MGSEWNQMVWDLVSQIPRGHVVTYGQVAAMLGFPRRSRHVGFALNQTPDGLELPWHRVINSRGSISFSPLSHQFLMQKTLLEAEGVELVNGRVDLKRFGWRP